METPSLSNTNFTKVRCNRKVARSKYEQNTPEIQKWWQQLFDDLEDDAAIKPHKRMQLLREVFPQRFLQKILSVLSVQDEKFKGEPAPPPVSTFKSVKKQKRSKSNSTIGHESSKSLIDLHEKELLMKELISKSSSTIQKRFGEAKVHKENPYLNFFNRRPDRAAIWRELPPLSLEDMNLSQKADAIARAIATNFVQWIKTLGGDEETSINVRSVLEMFEIASQNDSTKSLKVQLKEMPSVSPKVAEYMTVPQMSKITMLHQEIKRDKQATKKKPQIVAFGRRLPSEMQVKPLDEKEYRKWQRCERVPEKIATMAAVWQGITHLRSTKAFCEFLFNERPNVKPPKYLVDTGMMDPRSFSIKQDNRLSYAESFGEVSHLASILESIGYMYGTFKMKPEEEKVEDVINAEKERADGEPESSVDPVDKKDEEPQDNDEFDASKGTIPKIEEELNQISSDKNGSPTPRSPSVCDNRSETNTEILMRPKSAMFSAVVTPNRNLLGAKKSNSTADLQKFGQVRRAPTGKNKNENMVLQLVLPSTARNSSNENNNNFLSVRSVDDILDNGHLKERNARPHSVASQQDFYLARPNEGYINRAYSACDLKEYGHPGESPGAYSISATPTSFNEHEKPTSPEERKRAFRGLLTNVLSVFYALFNVTLGLAVYVSDIIDGTEQLAESFSLTLVVIAFLYILYLTIDIHLYMRKKERYEKLLENNMTNTIEMKETEEGHYQFNIPLPEVATLKHPLEHHYCFRKDRHSTNFYLKIGAAGFCFGHLIHSGLIIGYQIIFLTNNEDAFYECASVVTLALDILYPVYSFLLLFFIFKYSNVIINRYPILAHFGVMHCLSSSICFWIWTIFRETMEALANKDYETGTTAPPVEGPDYVEVPYALPMTSYGQKGAHILTEYMDITSRRFTAVCKHDDESFTTIYRDYSPYLYPFSVEYSILVVGILYLVWQNIGVCEVEDEEDQTRQCKTPSGNKDNTESNVVVHADCAASNKGLFGGFIIMVLTVVTTILFFIAIYTDDGRNGEIGVLLNIITSLIILSCMTLACIFAYTQITKLDINTAHHNLLDDILLFICIPAYFLNGIFSIIPAIIYANVIGSINICLEVFQVLLQTCFILDGLRRSSNTKELRKKKPGREMVTFLVISNVALWIMQTFEVKSHGMQDDRYEFYGKELWTILGHMCLPLMMFYRFHASVCIGDIWKDAYEPPGH